MMTTDLIRKNGLTASISDITSANRKRPEPTLGATRLVKNVFQDNPDKHFRVADVVLRVRSLNDQIDAKYISGILAKLAKPNKHNKTFLVRSSPGEYTLAKNGVVKAVASVPVQDSLSVWVAARASVQAEYNLLNDELTREEEQYRTRREPRMNRLVQLARALDL